MTSPPLVHFPWPRPPGAAADPTWTGKGFLVGDQRVGVLSYAIGQSGWSDTLTSFHEDTAGSNHPIDRASRDHALAQLRHLRTRQPTILEIGSSSGFMLRLIREQRPDALVVGSDYVLPPLERLAQEAPDLPLLHFDLCACPLPDNSVDAVLMLNVLEHIVNDRLALQQVFRILRPQGIAIIEVPAGPELFDVYDELLMHQRRYRMPELREKVRSAGFQIVSASHLGSLIYPPFYLVKRWNKRYAARDRASRQRVVAANIRATAASRLLDGLLKVESRLGQHIDWPFGIRCLVTARKPSAL